MKAAEARVARVGFREAQEALSPQEEKTCVVERCRDEGLSGAGE
jgi:hypothetical protein